MSDFKRVFTPILSPAGSAFFSLAFLAALLISISVADAGAAAAAKTPSPAEAAAAPGPSTLAAGPRSSGQGAGNPGPGTQRMVQRLDEIIRSADASRNVILNDARVELLRKRLAAATAPQEKLQLSTHLGEELLLSGQTRQGLEVLQATAGQAGPIPGEAGAAIRRKLRELLAIGYFRLGEQENCVQGHNADSCLMPIRDAGVHELDEGARRSRDEYLALLEEDPENLEYRWLVNLTSMALGEYPGKIPERWLIPPERFASEHELPRFRDVATATGVDAVGLAGGSIMEDFDGDGYLDIIASSWGLRDQIRYFRNDRAGQFEERTVAAGLEGLVGGLNLIQTDYDNDGFIDVLVLRGAWLGFFGEGSYPNSLLRNNGDGTFEDVTEAAGLLSLNPTQTATWGDYDNDGWLDLFVGNESIGPQNHPCELYRNRGDGTFEEVAAQAGVANVGFVKGAVWGDYDNDGRLDLYLSRFGQPNVLYRNLGPGDAAEGAPGTSFRFRDVTAEAGVAEPFMSFATWFWDYDNDGWQDLMVTPFLGFVARSLDTIAADYMDLGRGGEQPRLYRNRGDGTFEDATAAAGLGRPLLAMAANFGDLDNDGYLDGYFGTGEPNLATLVPNRMFRNAAGTFQDVTTSGGFGHLQKGHGIAFGDLDNDGDQDLYAVMGGAYSGDVYQNVLFENPGNDHRWITLRLEGVKANRSAIGSRIRVLTETAEGPREIHVTVGSGGSFGASSLQQEIGLGKAESVPAVEVTWAGTGETQRFEGLEPDRRWILRQGAPDPEAGDLERIALARDTTDRGGAHHHHQHAGPDGLRSPEGLPRQASVDDGEED